MPDLKPITLAGVPAALLKAHRYRLLNDSSAAESICQDILLVDPTNVDAIVTNVLAISDQFTAAMGDTLERARAAATQLQDPYRNAYYNGIVCERWAKAILHRGMLRAEQAAYDWFVRAMAWYEKAEAIRPDGNDEAILRWNTCVRVMARNPRIREREAEAYTPDLE